MKSELIAIDDAVDEIIIVVTDDLMVWSLHSTYTGIVPTVLRHFYRISF